MSWIPSLFTKPVYTWNLLDYLGWIAIVLGLFIGFAYFLSWRDDVRKAKERAEIERMQEESRRERLLATEQLASEWDRKHPDGKGFAGIENPYRTRKFL